MVNPLLKSLDKKRERVVGKSSADKGDKKSDEKKSTTGRQTPPPRDNKDDLTNSGAELLLQQQQEATIDTSVKYIPLDQIDIEEQVRDVFDPDFVEDLAFEFCNNGKHQPDHPVTVYSRGNGRYLLDDGENRMRAFRLIDNDRKKFGLTDPTLFTTIRASIKGDEIPKLDRTQSQAKLNLLRDDLTDIQIGQAGLQYKEKNAEATAGEIADWLGFRNRASGRVKVQRALQLMKCDDDLLLEVKRGQLALRKALDVQSERDSEANNTVESSDLATTPDKLQTPSTNISTPNGKSASGKKSTEKLEKAISGQKQESMSIPLNSIKTASLIFKALAESHELDDSVFKDKPTRKDLKAIFDNDYLKEILSKIS